MVKQILILLMEKQVNQEQIFGLGLKDQAQIYLILLLIFLADYGMEQKQEENIQLMVLLIQLVQYKVFIYIIIIKMVNGEQAMIQKLITLLIKINKKEQLFLCQNKNQNKKLLKKQRKQKQMSKSKKKENKMMKIQVMVS